jgi:signal transduction histidine kinase
MLSPTMGIGQRLAILVVLAVAFGMTAYGAYNIRARRAELRGEAHTESAELGTTLDVVLNEVLIERELSELSHLPDDISSAPRIYGLAVFDARDGTLITSRTIGPRTALVRAMAERAARENRTIDRSVAFGATETAAHAFPLRRHQREVVGAAVVLRDLSYVEPLVRASVSRIAFAGVVVALLVAGAAIGVARVAVSGPVARLIDGVHRIGEGDLTHPIAIGRRDEIGRIAAALNQMMTDLAAARVQIRRDLEARIALEKSVEFERRLQHAQRLAAIGQVAASLAHEIGSPLHVIAGRARFAADRAEPHEMRENLEVIATQADRITRVVEQLLSVARRRGPRIEPVGLEPVAQTVVELLGPQARHQGVDLQLDVAAPLARTSGDPDAVQQVLFNLVLNAIQAQPNGGTVQVAVTEVEELDSIGSRRPRVVIDVRDRGPGIPPEDRETIFEPFATTKSGSGGTGLGLAVVREIVRQHAGTVRALENPGGGAFFRVSLPSLGDTGD